MVSLNSLVFFNNGKTSRHNEEGLFSCMAGKPRKTRLASLGTTPRIKRKVAGVESLLGGEDLV